MSDNTCHRCGKHPGATSQCQSCGSAVYRYATDELSDFTSSRDLGAVPQDTTSAPLSDPHPRSTQIASAQIKQAPRPPAQMPPTDPFGESLQRAGSPAMNVLVRMLLIGLVLAVAIGTQFGAWADSQVAGLQIAPPTGEVDVTSTVPEPILLDSWGELQRGDCVLWPAEGDLLFLPTITDCSDRHDAEISGVHIIPGPDWPSSGDDLNLEDACKDTFPSYVGQQFDISEWHLGWVPPTEAEWDNGDHSYQCYVYLGSGQNSKRAYQSGT